MRKIKVAAVQPCLLYVPEEISPYTGKSRYDKKYIIENYVKKQIAANINLIERAGDEGCGIVSSCEDASVLADFALDITDDCIFFELAEEAQSLAEEAYSQAAKKYSMYVIGCSITKQNGKFFNTAQIFDRNGKIMGHYNKTHLPANETWKICAGDSLDVFELDFGKIGICICYDMMFPEPVRILALKGAEIIFHPTFGYGWYDSIGEATLRTRANDNGVYIVTSKNHIHNAAGKSSIIDYWGHVIASAGFEKDVIVTAEIDLDIKKKQPDWYFNSYMSGNANVSERMRAETRPELYIGEYEALREKNKNSVLLRSPEEKKKIIEDIIKGKCHW